MLENRYRILNQPAPDLNGSCIIHWMSRDQRVQDNWALIHAQQLALDHQVPLIVVFALSNQFLGATLRQYDFMLRGLAQVQSTLHKLHIPFYLLHNDQTVPDQIVNISKKLHPIAVVTDFSPLNIGRQWRESVAQNISVPLYEVDAHNIVPVWTASDHQEYAAHTLRPKLARLITEYLDEFPTLHSQTPPQLFTAPQTLSVESLLTKLPIDKAVLPCGNIQPGETAALQSLAHYIHHKLNSYQSLRNDPTQDAQSNLSPYLHFGQLSPQRVAMAIIKHSHHTLRPKLADATTSPEAFLEELITRRELAENYCFYNQNYDNFSGAPEWGKKTLSKHKIDKREYIYDLEHLVQAQTHDPIWNMCQIQMVKAGKMHGYLRMYWAKKILEWTTSPQKAIEYAIYLNDKYELDGRDPNGYVGIQWSITGLHDRPWQERPIFGQIRYMAATGLNKKFDLKSLLVS